MVGIKGMDMPKNCLECPCRNREYGYCQADTDIDTYEGISDRPRRCPLMEIKEADDEKLKDVALNFQTNISDKLLKENTELKKEIQALQTQIKESQEIFNKTSAPESMLNADLISRRAVYQELSLLLSDWDDDFNKIVSKCLKAVDKLPSIQPEQRWIPVSERLPKSSGVYIVTREFNDGFESANLTDACYFDGSIWYGDNRINHVREYVDKKIKAWMPLPGPWKGSE